MNLNILLMIAVGGSVVTYLLSSISERIRDAFAILVTLAVAVAVAMLYGRTSEVTLWAGFLGNPLLLRIGPISWLFAMTVSAIGCLSVVFSLKYMRGRERNGFYYAMLLLVQAAMLGVTLSGDLLSLFIFWEIMSWSTFLLISFNGGTALAAGMKYFVMSITGSLAMLVGVVFVLVSFNTLEISTVAFALSSAPPGYLWAVFLLFGLAFAVKSAIWPFHPWLPPAHSEAPSPFSAVLSGVLIKMGFFGLLVLMYVLIGRNDFLSLGWEVLPLHTILGVIGAVTILLPTFIALLQTDAKRLLAWSTVAQAGYIILGISFGTALGLAGGMLHFLSHATFKALLFMVAGAVEYRTGGIRDLNSLGGLIKRMPVTFAAALVGACGLIGVPLTNGFVSKWLIYKTLILEGSPFLAFVALIGTWGTILYSYKFLHNIFLGQLPQNLTSVEPAPFSMRVPMVVLMAVVVLFGVLPGIPLTVIDEIGVTLGFSALDVAPWGIVSESGVVNMLNISTAVVVSVLVAWLIFWAGKSGERVDQADSYAAGAAVPEGRYQYSMHFCDPLRRMVTPWLTDRVDAFYMGLTVWFTDVSDGLRRFYTGYVGHYVMYVVLFLSALIFVELLWSPW